ncbi:F-box and leucine-rich repeat protein 2/20 [Dioscorea alata]|uniref:F-box and leucine-rich repeat protein 2/20 n=1 Tax=Dioscorea alata TaxID=55571 RepID=A0ACB7UN84_DIOAL|nr:F-box and leucine-rich repeat protein 2/20 [Dioscorea alata]
MAAGDGPAWGKDTVAGVLAIVSTRLPLRDLCSLLLVSSSCYRDLLAQSTLWEVLDLREMSRAGERLISALSLARYQNVKRINLEFARDIEDEHFLLLRNKVMKSLHGLESLNLNGCQKITDKGIEAVTSCCPNLKAFFIYWNVRVTDLGIKQLIANCGQIVDLNLSGCKNISDRSLLMIAESYQELKVLNLTRCIKLTDVGLQQILLKCSYLESLNLYALSSLMDKAYKSIASLANLRFLDLCGAQNLSDEGLSCIAKCKNLVSLNLTWCVRITDTGVLALAQGCPSLEFLSLFGIVGVTDASLEALSKSCSNTLTTLDVNGCIGIKRRSHEDLLLLFPYLRCFKVEVLSIGWCGVVERYCSSLVDFSYQ